MALQVSGMVSRGSIAWSAASGASSRAVRRKMAVRFMREVVKQTNARSAGELQAAPALPHPPGTFLHVGNSQLSPPALLASFRLSSSRPTETTNNQSHITLMT